MRFPTTPIVLGALAVAPPALVSAQPVEWAQRDGGNGHFYEYVEARGVEWNDAASAALQRVHEGLRGRLVTITSAEENRFILDHVVPLNIQEAWLGARLARAGGGWEWVSEEPWEYENWQPGAPNDSDPAAPLAMVPGMAGQWNDERLARQVRGYIVEYERDLGADGEGVIDEAWTSTFYVEEGELVPTGRNLYFVLEPGHTLEFVGPEGDLVITVLDETRVVDGVETRVVEERETEGGELVEVSRNFFAISRRTNSIYYFGEEVDIYEDGELVGHGGAWLSGENGARFGMIMPGDALRGARHYQEVAPGVALDRAEIVGTSEALTTPAGKFTGCLRVLETTPLEPAAKEYKLYAPGVGLVHDGPMRLLRFSPAQGRERPESR